MAYKPRRVGAGMMVAAALLVGCAGLGKRLPPPPPATEAQIEKEMHLLQTSFFSDPCMAKLRQQAVERKPGDAEVGARALYAVEYAPNTQRPDGLAYRLHVQERWRVAYLYISDGTAGSYRIYGPLPLWTCLYARLP